MTTKDKAEKLAERCVDEICAMTDCDDAKMIVEHCCLVELLDVAVAAKDFRRGILTASSIDEPLAALRAKLPKELQ